MRSPELTESFGRWIRGWLPSEPVGASRERRAHPRLGISALTVAVIVFVAVGIAAEFVLLPKTSSGASTVTTSTSTMMTYSCTGCSPPPPLKDAVNQWASDFNSRDVTGLSNFYATDAMVDWTGHASGLTGVYNGEGNIRILYGSSIGKTTSLIANISDYNEEDVNPSNANVSLTLTMNGVSTVVGNLSISVDADQQWNYVGGQWQIVKESWNYVKFYESTPVSSTTFPQWTAIKLGQNPNLVSEKSFEWHAGPYVAVFVYAFIAGIFMVGVVKFRNRSRQV
jgi:hypothetical protein